MERAVKVACARAHTLKEAQLHRIREVELHSKKEIDSQAKEISKLKEILSQRDLEIRELRYELGICNKKEKEFQFDQLAKISQDQNKVAVENLKISLRKVESKVKQRGESAVRDINCVLRLLSGIERHSLQGRHFCATRTVSDLLVKCRSSLEILRSNMQRDEWQPCQSSKSDALDNAVMDMCKNLEEENVKLSDLVTALKLDLEHAQRDSSVSDLIPHYRLAIIRSRNHCGVLQEALTREQATSNTLREQLDRTFFELKSVGVVGSSEVEFDREGKGGRQRRNSEIPPPPSSSLYSFASRLGNVYLEGSEMRQEGRVRSDLRTLDAEIDELKDQLGKAALQETKEVVAKVLDVVAQKRKLS